MRILTFLLLILFFVSCSEKSNPETDVQKKQTKDTKLHDFSVIQEIDKNVESIGKLASSLSYSKEDGEAIQVLAHFDEKNNLSKLDEKFKEAKTGNQGVNSFYFKNGLLYATKEYYQDYKLSQEGKFVERLSFYDKKGEAIKSIQKIVDFEEDLDKYKFVEIKPVKITIDRAQRALNQQNEFETTFQGFVNANSYDYLVVGGRGKNAFSSAIRINNADGFIQFLKKDVKKHLNRKIQVSFEIITENAAYEYQSYIQGTFVD